MSIIRYIRGNASKALIITLLCCSVLAPKLSLTLFTALGFKYDTVLLCSGSSLIEVTIDSNGEIVTDVTKAWKNGHCAPATSPHTFLSRTWYGFQYPQYHLAAQLLPPQESHANLYYLTRTHARAPPVS